MHLDNTLHQLLWTATHIRSMHPRLWPDCDHAGTVQNTAQVTWPVCMACMQLVCCKSAICRRVRSTDVCIAGADVLEQIRDTRRRIHSVAALAHAAADVASPLLLSASLKVHLHFGAAHQSREDPSLSLRLSKHLKLAIPLAVFAVQTPITMLPCLQLMCVQIHMVHVAVLGASTL